MNIVRFQLVEQKLQIWTSLLQQVQNNKTLYESKVCKIIDIIILDKWYKIQKVKRKLLFLCKSYFILLYVKCIYKKVTENLSIM